MIQRHFFAIKHYRWALLSAFFFGCIAPGTKLLTHSLGPQSLAGVLYLSAGLGLFVLLYFNAQLKSSLASFHKRDLFWLSLIILFGGILGPLFLTYGIFKMTASSASLLLNLEAVLTSALAWFVFKEHCDKKIVYGMISIVLGCLILSFKNASGLGFDTWEGYFLLCLACLSWAIDNNLTRKISHLNPMFTASLKGLIAGSMNLFLAYLLGERLAFNSDLLYSCLLGFFGIGVSLVAFILSLKELGTARTGAIFSTAPFMGALLSLIFLGENINFLFLVALLFMALGVWFHFSERHAHLHVHEEFTHTHEHTHDDLHHEHVHSYGDSHLKHSHEHRHSKMTHEHVHFPDIHHRHGHKD